MALKRIPTSFSCIVAVILLLVGLAYLPPLIQRTKYQFTVGTTALSEKAFPIDDMLAYVSKDPKLRTATLRQLAAQSPGGLLVNFWATWCPPCLEELPSLEFLHRQLKASPSSKIPQLVTISVDETKEAITSLYRTLDFSPSFLVLHDQKGDLARAVGTTKFPETYWINGEGKILHKWIGPQNWLGNEVLRTLSLLSQG